MEAKRYIARIGRMNVGIVYQVMSDGSPETAELFTLAQAIEAFKRYAPKIEDHQIPVWSCDDGEAEGYETIVDNLPEWYE